MQRPLTAYERWLEKEGLPVLSGYAVDNVLAASLKPWARLGGKGAYVNLAAFDHPLQPQPGRERSRLLADHRDRGRTGNGHRKP